MRIIQKRAKVKDSDARGAVFDRRWNLEEIYSDTTSYGTYDEESGEYSFNYDSQ